METKAIKLKMGRWTANVSGVSDVDGFVRLCCMENKESALEFEVVNCSKSTKVFCFQWAGQAYYYKEFSCRNVLKQLRAMPRGAHLKQIAGLLNEAGFETPRIVCHARSGLRAFVVSEAANSDDSVHSVLLEQSTVPDLMRFRFLLGKEIGRLHVAGFAHGDLRWGNVLVRAAGSEQPAFIYIDNDRTRKYRRIPSRLRVKNLVQLNFAINLREMPRADWDAIWKGYVSVSPDIQSKADCWRRRIDVKSDRRVAAWWKKPRNRHLLEKKMAKEAGH